ncbi:porin family protein [Dyadobacter sandarakinus]|uniref:PorT family protein n=1 Tax=Dyadobacter sandarakinus TaxID=2747268 RepID=A0ABX7I4Q2_9BACT|nr:porin family protein [Dyadobacter sandarakinus]QRR01084.1 PorT family protein [Dyadobacter sandarakinus]
MKNCIILLLLTTLTVPFAHAQENVSIGPMVGLNLSNFRGDNADMSMKPGLAVGGFYNYSSKTGFGFSGQLLFSQMGARTYNKNEAIRLNYIQAPLLATFFFGRYGSGIRPKAFLGPNVNFLVGARNKDGKNINGEAGNRVFKPFDLGLTFGAGLNYRLKNKVWLNTDVRYGLGLFNVVRNNTRTLRNNVWSINAGLSFPLGTYDRNTGRLKTR